MSISTAISRLKPDGTGFIIKNDDLSTLEWSNPTDNMPTDEEIIAEAERIQAELPANIAREERNRLLAKSDWMVVRAYDTGEALAPEWQEYRQALRDITQQSGFPDSIQWPQEPTA